MMPLHTFATIALHNFMDWIGVKHFTAFWEDLPEFNEVWYPSNLVNIHYSNIPIFFIQIYKNTNIYSLVPTSTFTNVHA